LDVEVNASVFNKEIQELDAMLDEINNHKNNNENNRNNDDDELTDDLNEEEKKSDQAKACSADKNKDTEEEKILRKESFNE
jgi:hypothetical protein